MICFARRTDEYFFYLVEKEDHENEDDDENEDIITDSWGDEVLLADQDNSSNDQNQQKEGISKEKLSKTIERARTLIKTIRSSQILIMFMNNEKLTLKIFRQLLYDCITRWNSTYISIDSLMANKLPILSLFENQRKLPITGKQKDKLSSLELSSDEWAILENLLIIFEPFFQATLLLSGSKYPTSGLCLFTIRHLKEYLETDDENQSNILCFLKKLVQTTFNEYFNENDHHHMLILVSDCVFKSP